MKGILTLQGRRFVLPFLLLLLAFTTTHAQITVSGQLATPQGIPISGFAIYASGTLNKIAYTDINGMYEFSLPAGSYSIAPVNCNANPLNGVTTYDRVLALQHYQGTQLLSSPYAIIAAELTGDQVIDKQDDSIFVRMILGIITSFPVDNYRFVLQNYTFPDPQNPFDPMFPASFNIPDLQSNVSGVDFYAIKAGDLNNTAFPPNDCTGLDLPASIGGTVFQDLDSDCEYDTGEPGLNGWIVSASDGANIFYGVTSSSGYYEINTLPGTYLVTLSKPNNLWGGCNDTISGVNVVTNEHVTRNFGKAPAISCPNLNVELSSWGARRCFSNVYQVNYCNLGTAAAADVHVEVQLDPYFIFESGNVPATDLGGNKYSFYVGNVPVGQCGSFVFTYLLSCDAELGQTHCSEARIFPDTICTQPEASWGGPDLTVTGICTGDNVKFTIKNQGTSMTQPLNYIVVEDIVVMAPPFLHSFQLDADESLLVTIPANGTTVRLEVDQPPGHPWASKVSAAVEGCGVNVHGGHSLGMINNFPLFDNAPNSDIDCVENMGSFDPNDKQGLPKGIGNEHFIPIDQPIDYLIRFQNTGTDTAFTVMIRDTLDKKFDISTFRFKGSSHPVAYNISGEGVLQFVFTNIMLPDSNVNEPGSHGYVKFSVNPKKETPNGTVVRNQASIYFDFNDAVVTNKTWHTFGEHYLSTGDHPGFPSMIGVELFPNPVSDNLRIVLESPGVLNGQFYVYDLYGRLVAVQHFDHNNFNVNTSALTSGCYVYKFHSGNRIMATGKFVKISAD